MRTIPALLSAVVIAFAPLSMLTALALAPMVSAAPVACGGLTDSRGNNTAASHNQCCTDAAAMGQFPPECASGPAPIRSAPPGPAPTTNNCSPYLDPSLAVPC
jgi:hypothetical protein